MLDIKFTSKEIGKLVVERPITEEDVETVIVNCFEGGSTYWLGLNNSTEDWKEKPKGVPLSTWATKLLLDGKTVNLYDIEDEEETWELTLEKLIKGFSLNATKRPKDSDLETGDSITTDSILQFALFGELVYG